MPDALLQILLYTLAAGLAVPIGGLFACLEKLPRGEGRNQLLHMITAFGGGVLLAAVALVLVPKGAKDVSIGWTVAAFLGGALIVYGIDRAVEQRGSRAAQLIALLLDFVPEALALGALFTANPQAGVLLALLIGLQNLPEGFNAFCDLRSSGLKYVNAMLLLGAIALLGPAAGALGYFMLSDQQAVCGGIMLGASAGILYLTFQDIAPQAKYRGHWSPALGAALGFLVGLIGHMVLGGH